MKIYLYIGLLLALTAGAWKLYDAGGDAREDKVRLEFAEKQQAKDDEILKLKAEIDAKRTEAEKIIIEEKVVYRDRIKTVKQVVNECVIPPDILRVLYDAGIYTGEI